MRLTVIGAFPARNRHAGNRRRVDVRFHLCRGNGVVVLIGAGKRIFGRNNPIADISAGKRPGRGSHRNLVAADNAGKRGVRNHGIAAAVVGLILSGKGERQRFRRDFAGHLGRFGIAVHRGVADPDLIRSGVAGFVLGPGLAAVGGVLNLLDRIDGIVGTDQ